MVAGHLQTKKGYYYMVLNLKSEDGNRKSKWISTGIPATGKKSAKLAEEMLAETRCTYKDAASPCAVSPVISREDISFSDYMIKWLGIIKNSVEVDTYAGYVNNIEKRIVPYFRGQRILLRELTALDVENFYSYCFNELHLKGTTVQRFHANIHKAMKYARKHDLIASNPMDNVERPKSQRYVGAFYSVSELETLFQAVKGDPCEFPVLMAAFYGLRRSEIMGLRWRAIDFENNLITIDHTVVQCMCDGTTITVEKDRTKNQSSCRSMPLVPQYRDLLLRMKVRQECCRKLCGNCYTESEYIFVNDMGEPYQPNYVTQHFKLVLRKNHLRNIRFHDLRHPYVKHTTKIFSLRLMDFQAQAYPDARRKTRGACQLHRGGQSQSPVRPLCNRKQLSCLLPQSKMSWILYAISMRLSGYTSTRSISSSASSVVSASASKIALDASFRLSCRACSSCFCFACANTAA